MSNATSVHTQFTYSWLLWMCKNEQFTILLTSIENNMIQENMKYVYCDANIMHMNRSSHKRDETKIPQ